MQLCTDQLARSVSLPNSPRRIVSLVPSQTELLYDLGLDSEVVGITKFCVHPEKWFRTKTRVGGTKGLNLNAIEQLQPDLIIANKEENLQSDIETLEKNYPVWISDIKTLADALQMIHAVGEITATTKTASTLIRQIKNNFQKLEYDPRTKYQTTYLIWKDPFMTVGGDAFIHDMLNRCGFKNMFGHESRYPKIEIEQLQSSSLRCELLLLSSEPYPFKQKHVDELQQMMPNTKILLVDGEMFSWYGSRLLHAPTYFQSLLHQLV